MNAYDEKSRRSPGRSLVDESSRGMNRTGNVSAGFADRRPVSLAQRTLQTLASNSPQVMQLRTIQQLAGRITQVNQPGLPQPVQLRTSDGTTMAGVVVPNAAQLRRITTLLGRIGSVGALMRSARTLDTEGDVRLDMQGMTTAGYYNLQIQIGDGTVANVLLNPAVGEEQLGEVVQAFTDSRTSGLTKIVDPDEEPEEKPKRGGYYDDYKSLSRHDKDMIDRAMRAGVYPPPPVK